MAKILEGLLHNFSLIGWTQIHQLDGFQLVERAAGEPQHRRIDSYKVPVSTQRHDRVQAAIEKRTIALQGFIQRGAGSQQCFGAFSHALFERFIQLAQLFLRTTALSHFFEQRAVGHLIFAGLAVQLGEDRDFRAQHRRVHRLVQIIHCAGAVALEHILILIVKSSEEDDRHLSSFLAILDHLGQFKAVHAGHLDVQDE